MTWLLETNAKPIFSNGRPRTLPVVVYLVTVLDRARSSFRSHC